MTEKQAIRRAARRARADFTPSGPIVVAPEFLHQLRSGLIVAAYLPIGGEADPAPLADAARAQGCVMALPVTVDHKTPIAFLPHHDGCEIVDGPFGLRQPALRDKGIAPSIILTPLLAFDRRGNRVGQGAGHYDRAFATYPQAWRIGIAWSVQEVAACPADAWDVPLHAIATEKEWITP